MTPQMTLLLAIIALVLVLFSLERIPPDVIALVLLLSLILTGILPADVAFSGFGNEAVLMILALLVMTAALGQAGIVQLTGRFVIRHAGSNPRRLSLMIMSASAALSAFMSNTGATAFFLPIVLSLSRQLRISASKLLMPLAFATILASSVTLIGTSTNIVISGMMRGYGMPALGMFELTLVGLPILLVGLFYMQTIGERLIPDRTAKQVALDGIELQAYLFEVEVLEDSSFAGLSLAESKLGEQFDLTVLRVMRRRQQIVMPSPHLVLEAGDQLLVEGEREKALATFPMSGLQMDNDTGFSDSDLESESVGIYEVVLMPGSPVLHRTIAGLHFRENYGLQVLGVNHHGDTRFGKLSQVPMQAGDLLLVQGHRQNVNALEEQGVFRIMRLVPWSQPDRKRSILTVLIFVGSLATATFNLLSLPVAVVLGMVLMFISRSITPERAYREVNWSALILIGSMLSLGLAMESTGTARYLADRIVEQTGMLPPVYLLGGFFVLTMLLTQPMSNQAAAIVVVPVALQTAAQLGLNPRSFAVMIALGASCSFLTPLEPAALLVYGPGNYRFFDFLKVGLLLTVAILVIAMLLVPLIWPL